MDWYEEYIEEPVREVVRLLRQNGVNTECSCGHEMYVQCQYIPEGEVQRIHDLLYNGGLRNYSISVMVNVMDGHVYPTMNIKFPKEMTRDSCG